MTDSAPEIQLLPITEISPPEPQPVVALVEWAIVKDGLVVLTIEAENAPEALDGCVVLPLLDGAGTNWRVLPDGTWQEPDAMRNLSFATQEIPLWAAQAALKMAGLYEAVDAAVTAVRDTNPPAYFAWTMGNFASRNSPFIKTLRPQLGFTDQQIDMIFVSAKSIADAA